MHYPANYVIIMIAGSCMLVSPCTTYYLLLPSIS
uniref:Uncharacterized protein n=1 Tax=Rhizophora mucronata TaxID=61149 RepID=A0A2P2Q4H7_RHIMU